jgi:hypothetical protein
VLVHLHVHLVRSGAAVGGAVRRPWIRVGAAVGAVGERTVWARSVEDDMPIEVGVDDDEERATSGASAEEWTIGMPRGDGDAPVSTDEWFISRSSYDDEDADARPRWTRKRGLVVWAGSSAEER